MLPLTCEEFHQTTNADYPKPLARQIGIEREWWRSDHLLGLVVEDRVDQDFGYVVLGHDPKGVFRAVHVKVSMPTQAHAHDALMAKMADTEATGQTVFIQD